MNPFLRRIEQGKIATLDELSAAYKVMVKALHPDLAGPGAPPVDFDRLKKHYREAAELLVARDEKSRDEESPPPGGSPRSPEVPRPHLGTRDAYLDEFRNLVARGFPVNQQALAKNRAYQQCVDHIKEYLDDRMKQPGFFDRADLETRALKRLDAQTHWYVLQIFWNIGDYRVTGFDYYRRIYLRHLKFIRPTLVAENLPNLLRLLDDLVADDAAKARPRPSPSRARS